MVEVMIVESSGPADQVEIMASLNHLAALLDQRRWDLVHEVIADDAFAYGATGIDEVIAVLRRNLGGCGPSQHLLGNHQVALDGDAAASLTEARVYHQGAGDRSHLSWECIGTYRDDWRRTADGWRMTRREFTVRIAIGDIEVLQPG